MQEWDVSFSPTGGGGKMVQVRIPTEISESLQARGLWRARLSLTAQGILLVPYEAPPGTSGRARPPVELPEWGR